ncbi:MAG TPA: tetratricopeptide repeat protein, partial [Aequorivita sp.]|nr:tetratricopeptide repeat protein [Aequorivita sp.]
MDTSETLVLMDTSETLAPAWDETGVICPKPNPTNTLKIILKIFCIFRLHSIHNNMVEFSFSKNKFSKRVLLLLCCCFTVFSLTAQENEQLKHLLDQAKEAQANQDYAEALKLYMQGELIAEKDNVFKWLWYIKNNQGNIYMSLSNYGEALGYFNEAMSIIDKHPELASKKVVVLNNTALLYVRNKEPEKALITYKKAYALIGKDSSPYNKYVKVVLATNIADVYNTTNQLEKAHEILMEVQEKLDKPYVREEGKQAWQINYAENLFLKGETARAEKMMEELLPKTAREKEENCYICVLELLSRIYEKQEKRDLAIYHIKKALETNQELADEVKFYDQLARLYNKQGRPQLALNYKDSVIHTREKLTEKINHQLFAVNKVKLGIQEYQNQLEINSEKRKRDHLVFIVVGVLVLVVFYAVYKGQRNRIAKQRKDREIAANKQKIIKLELKELKGNIAEKNRRLSAKALYLSDRNDIIEEVVDSLAAIPEV